MTKTCTAFILVVAVDGFNVRKGKRMKSEDAGTVKRHVSTSIKVTLTALTTNNFAFAPIKTIFRGHKGDQSDIHDCFSH